MADFIQAMKWMEDGYKVRIETWENKEYYWWVDTDYTFDNLWCINDPDGETTMIRSWIESNDWVIYYSPNTGKVKV